MNSKSLTNETITISAKKIKNMNAQISELQENNIDLQIKLNELKHKHVCRTIYTMTDSFSSKLNDALNKLYREVALGTKKSSDVIRCFEFFISIYMKSLVEIVTLEEQCKEKDALPRSKEIESEMQRMNCKMSMKCLSEHIEYSVHCPLGIHPPDTIIKQI